MFQNDFECFFVPTDLVKENQVIISGNEFRHLHRVKRKKVGDQVYVSDGDGNLFTVELTDIKATQAIAEIVKIQRLVGEPLVAITVAQGIIRSQRMDWLIEKGTELGVRQFIPVQTDFTQMKTSELKYSRWERLAQAALKQCGRSYLPQIAQKQVLADLIDTLPKPVLFAHPGGKNTVRDVLLSIRRKLLDPIRNVSLLIGPEGGFSEEEVRLFSDWGFHQVRLGERRLRAETAAIAMIILALEALDEI